MRLIYFGTIIPTNPPTDFEGSFSVIIIEPEVDSLGMNGIGDLTFYNWNGNSYDIKRSKFLGRESVIAAIFSETQEQYECSIGNAIREMQASFKVLVERIKMMEENDDFDRNCKTAGYSV